MWSQSKNSVTKETEPTLFFLTMYDLISFLHPARLLGNLTSTHPVLCPSKDCGIFLGSCLVQKPWGGSAGLWPFCSVSVGAIETLPVQANDHFSPVHPCQAWGKGVWPVFICLSPSEEPRMWAQFSHPLLPQKPQILSLIPTLSPLLPSLQARSVLCQGEIFPACFFKMFSNSPNKTQNNVPVISGFPPALCLSLGIK